MNSIAWIVLAALLVEWALHLVADRANLRALSSEPPPELRELYDPEEYRRSQEYTRAKTRFGLWPTTLELASLLALWFGGGFAWLDEVVRSFGWGPVPTGLLFVGSLMAARTLFQLPFSWYGTFVLEERFGFNRTTRATFVADALKGLVLGVIVGAPLLAGILALFERFGPEAWFAGWAATAGFVLLLQLLIPTWILPLFFKFQPLPEGELRTAVLAYGERVGFPLKEVYVVDGSRRSTKANAFFTGFGKAKRVALFDTMVERYSPQELLAVVAHEVGHYKLKHIPLTLGLSLARLLVQFFLLSLVLSEPGLYAAFGLAEPSVYAGLVFFALLYTPVELVLGFALQAVSRRHEFQADRFAVETTGLGSELGSALERLSADSLANLTPHPLYVALHHTHPPLRERLSALRALAPG